MEAKFLALKQVLLEVLNLSRYTKIKNQAFYDCKWLFVAYAYLPEADGSTVMCKYNSFVPIYKLDILRSYFVFRH